MVTMGPKSAEKFAQLFHALSDPTRLEILERLKGGEQCVCELTDALKAAQSRLSFHLKVLKDADLLMDRRDGRWMYYSINQEALEDLEHFIKDLRRSLKTAAAGRCC